ncbi:hypothetical protein GCM10020221_28710 [Streptomyces thioluteus]|uniref:MFS transporter n=1 Tax=Streptomyces thioluteus TaxID=66431 RepID=A0ABN3X048_STRTU
MSETRPETPPISETLVSETPLPAAEEPSSAAPAPAGFRALRAHPALVLAGIVLASLNMRAALSGVSPLVGEINDHFGLNSTASSLVTTIPLVFMGLGSIVAPRLARRLGTETVLCSALVLLCGGILLRVAPPVVTLFVGGRAGRHRDRPAQRPDAGADQARLPGARGEHDRPLLDRHDPRRHRLGRLRRAAGEGPSAAGGARSPPGRCSPPSRWSSGSRRPCSPGAGDTTPRRRRPGSPRPDAPNLLRSGLAWQVTLLMGTQSLVAYVCIAWMPTIFTDNGMDKSTAGLVYAFYTLVQMAGSFVVPMLAGRLRDQRLLAVGVVVLMAAGTTGLLLAPVAGAWAWAHDDGRRPGRHAGSRADADGAAHP